MTACTKKQYPYPDENIFFITGVNTDVQPIDYSKTTPLIIVSRKPEVALAKYEDMGALHKAKPVGCLSLAQLRVFHGRLASCLDDPNTKELKAGLLGAMLGKRQPWMIASMDDKGEPTMVDFVVARSSADVLNHAKVSKRVTPAIYSLELFSEMISWCEKVKSGTAKDIVYAIDYKGGEFDEHVNAIENTMTQEDKDFWELEIQAALDAKSKGLIK